MITFLMIFLIHSNTQNLKFVSFEMSFNDPHRQVRTPEDFIISCQKRKTHLVHPSNTVTVLVAAAP